jgi:hypothetical protein
MTGLDHHRVQTLSAMELEHMAQAYRARVLRALAVGALRWTARWLLQAVQRLRRRQELEAVDPTVDPRFR